MFVIGFGLVINDQKQPSRVLINFIFLIFFFLKFYCEMCNVKQKTIVMIDEKPTYKPELRLKKNRFKPPIFSWIF